MRVKIRIFPMALGMVILLIPLFSTAEVQNWPYKPYDHVKICLYNLDNSLHQHYRVIKNSRLDPTTERMTGPLTSKQTNTLIDLLNRNIFKKAEGLSKSHIPHHAIILFDKMRRPVAEVSICFDCETLRYDPPLKSPSKKLRELTAAEIKRFSNNLKKMKEMVLKLGLPVMSSPFEYQKLQRSDRNKKQSLR